MKNGYEVIWTGFALDELAQTIKYLEENWTEKEIKIFSVKLEETVILISRNPNLFQISTVKKDVRRAIVAKHNTLYYQKKGEQIEVISFFSHRQNSKKRNLK
ncbi:type II toxin-antitoxin system RelE/ParE family toxin [bacterium]|nr:MAG: type II toxin-antitoxin system RelE/ParE family toxin [bacterium]